MNWWIFLMAVLFSICETGHFGNNMLPHSDAEFICDGISLVLFALSLRQVPLKTPPERTE